MLSTPKAKEDEGLAQPNNVRTLITQYNVKGVLETKYKLIIHKGMTLERRNLLLLDSVTLFFPN